MDFLKNYTITLETIGPVYIGSGKKMMKKEWIKDKRNAKAIIPDDVKLFRLLQKKNLIKSYEEYMLKQNIPLDIWFRQNNIGDREISEITAYAMDAGSVGDLNRQSEINSFIKDSYGLPYVPGSSLKGAIRNIIMAKMITDNGIAKQDYDNLHDEIFNPSERNGKKFLKRQADKINQDIFNTRNLPETKKSDAVNDIMRGIRISDSKPLSLNDLSLCQKIDITAEDKENDLNLLRECIRPETCIEFDLTIDSTETNIDVEYIKEAIDSFLKQYNEMYLGNYPHEELYDSQVIYLGGGVGMASKTVINQVLRNDKDRVRMVSKIIDATLNRDNQTKHKHYRDAGFGVSPHAVKLTEFNGRLYQFGPCSITIEPK